MQGPDGKPYVLPLSTESAPMGMYSVPQQQLKDGINEVGKEAVLILSHRSPLIFAVRVERGVTTITTATIAITITYGDVYATWMFLLVCLFLP